MLADTHEFSSGSTVWNSAASQPPGSRIACRAQATSRVDVDLTPGFGGHDVPLPVLSQAPGTHNSAFEKFRSVPGLCQRVGWTHVMAGCSGDMLVDDLMDMVAMREGVLVACFCMVGAGSRVLHSKCEQSTLQLLNLPWVFVLRDLDIISSSTGKMTSENASVSNAMLRSTVGHFFSR